ncbi:NAD(P)/FAD-dependent oxidoreductase [Flavobacterium sp. MAHUQ-51]|uniref:NAD(P)/FAD-dependent oxidoreductase n=1 Tax=Flavobacterium sp. GCM10022190 TaxID=3252639 RepID=UPI00361BA2C5
MDKIEYEVIIIGGIYAGLSAAMALGRSLRNVLIIDNDQPCNRQTPHSHNFLTQDGKTPLEISNQAKKEIKKYKTINFHKGLAKSGVKTENGFEIVTERNNKFTTKKLIFATGIKDNIPEIKGFSECWGISIIHCPYCHGYEYRNQKTAIIANGQRAFHLASLVNNLSDKVTILTNGKADFSSEQLNKLNKHNIKIIENHITEIDQQKGKLKNVIFKEGNKISLDAAYAAIPFTQHSEIPASLGCELNEQGYIKIDTYQKTTIPDIYACGDNSNLMRSVANAVSSGNIAGAVVNSELTQEQF